MRIKKVLSLAVVLAMVLTAVPMFGLTASAAGEAPTYFTDEELQKLLTNAGEAIFTDTPIYGSTDDVDFASSTYKAAGWTLQTGNPTIKGKRFDEGTGEQHNGLLAYNRSSDGGINVDTSPAIKDATSSANADYFIIDFGTKFTNNARQIITLYSVANPNSSNKTNTFLKFSYNNAGITANTGINQSEDGDTKQFIPDSNKEFLGIRIYVAKNTSEDYTLIWQTNSSGEYKQVYKLDGVPASHVQDGFASMRIFQSKADSGHLALLDLKVYAGKYDAFEAGDANVVVKYYDNDQPVGEPIFEEGGHYPGDAYTYTPEGPEFKKINDTWYKVDVTPKTIDSLISGENEIKIPVTKYKVLNDNNYVINGDFSGNSTGWYTMKGNTFDSEGVEQYSKDNKNYDYGKISIVNGTLSTKSVQHADSKHNGTSIEARWPVEPNKSYLLTVEMTSTKDATHQYAWFGTFKSTKPGTDDRTNWIADYVGDDGVSGHMDNLRKDTVVKKEFGVSTKSDDHAVGFQSSWLGDANVTYDNFAVHELVPDTDEIVSVQYVDSGTNVGTAFEAVKGTTLPARTFLADGKIYTAPETQITENDQKISLEVKQSYALKELTLPENDTTWDGYHVACASTDADTHISDDDGKSLTSDPWGGYGSKRTLTAKFAKPTVAEGQLAILHITIGACRRNNGASGTSNSRLKVSANGAAAFTTGHDETANGITMDEPDTLTADITSLVKATDTEDIDITIEANGSIGVIDQYQAGFNGKNAGAASYIEVVTPKTITVTGAVEGALITKNGSKVTLADNKFYALEDDVIRIYKGADNESGLAQVSDGKNISDVTTIGQDTTELTVVEVKEVNVTPSLGFNADNAATIDFSVDQALDDGYQLVITREDSGFTQTVKGPEITDNVINLKPANSNIIYTVTVQRVVGEATKDIATAKASLYSVVADDLKNNVEAYTSATTDAVNPDRLKAVNEIIANGGVIYNDTTPVEKAADIVSIETSEETGTVISIKEPYNKLGFGFLYKAGTIYYGTAEESKAITAEDADEDTVYDVITINGETVTLSQSQDFGSAKPAEAITLSLDSVNIEFIETLIEELEADGADAELDLIPEL